MTDLHAEFRQVVGREAIRQIAAAVAWGHVRSSSLGEESFGEVGIERAGVLRWIQIDADLLKMAGKLPGVEIGLFHNSTGGQRHVEIKAGQFRLLVIHDRAPDALVPHSVYGKTLAQENQGYLFEEQRSTDASCYWAVLFHSKSESKGEVPDRLEIRFPDGADGYAVEHLRLYAEFPELRDAAIVAQLVGEATAAHASEEVVVNEATPTLRSAENTGT